MVTCTSSVPYNQTTHAKNTLQLMQRPFPLPCHKRCLHIFWSVKANPHNAQRAIRTGNEGTPTGWMSQQGTFVWNSEIQQTVLIKPMLWVFQIWIMTTATKFIQLPPPPFPNHCHKVESSYNPIVTTGNSLPLLILLVHPTDHQTYFEDNCIERSSSRFLQSPHRNHKLSLTRMPEWPGHSHMQIMCTKLLSHAICPALCGMKGQLSFQVWQSKSHFTDRAINWWREGGNRSTQRKPLTLSFRKCDILQLEKIQAPTETWTCALALVAGTC